MIRYTGLVCLLLICGCSRCPVPHDVAEGERVVSLAPNLTEIICAIGAENNLVGRTSACDYPPEILRTVPVIGGFGTPALDSLIRVDPTLVLDVDLENESIGKMIERVGLRRERVRCASLDDIPGAILKVGDYLDRRDAARELSDVIIQRVAELRAAADTREDSAGLPLVYVEIWGDPLMTVGRDSFVSELIRLAGGRNIGDEALDREYFSVSSEWVIARDPDVIICLYMSDARTITESVGSRPGWSGIKAVKANRVYGGLNNCLILRPGPRVLAGIESLSACIAGEETDIRLDP